MKLASPLILFAAVVLAAIAGLSHPTTARDASQAGPRYARDGSLALPTDYREWTFLTSGFDMSYRPAMLMAMDDGFDNVFVDPSAYRSFVRTGTWPNKTMLVLEHRLAQKKGSINIGGAFQTAKTDVEIHVRDDARFSGRWAFFAFGAESRFGTLLPQGADCYTCHAKNGAVDTTFVQFYPTLLPIAKAKGTLSRSYRETPRR